jgi:hypothetical protein
MPAQFWVSLLNNGDPFQTANGTALSTATTATISPQAATNKDFAVPANYFYRGQTLRIRAAGFTTTTTTSTTLTFFLASNINNAGTYVTLATTAGITTSTTAATGAPWWLTAFITCTAFNSGGSASLTTQGHLFHQSTAATPALNGTSNLLHFGLPSASGASTANVDLTSQQGFALRATLAGANATVQCTNFDIEAMN